MASSTLKTYLEPESLAMLQGIFDEAWRQINALPARVAAAGEFEERRTDLAQMIMLAHRSGVAPDRIKDTVLGRIIPGNAAV